MFGLVGPLGIQPSDALIIPKEKPTEQPTFQPISIDAVREAGAAQASAILGSPPSTSKKGKKRGGEELDAVDQSVQNCISTIEGMIKATGARDAAPAKKSKEERLSAREALLNRILQNNAASAALKAETEKELLATQMALLQELPREDPLPTDDPEVTEVFDTPVASSKGAKTKKGQLLMESGEDSDNSSSSEDDGDDDDGEDEDDGEKEDEDEEDDGEDEDEDEEDDDAADSASAAKAAAAAAKVASAAKAAAEAAAAKAAAEAAAAAAAEAAAVAARARQKRPAATPSQKKQNSASKNVPSRTDPPGTRCV